MTPEDRELVRSVRRRHAESHVGNGRAANCLCNYREVKDRGKTYKHGLSARQIFESVMQQTGGWPKRIGERLFVIDGDNCLQWSLSTEALFSWLNSRFATQGGNGVRWGRAEDQMTKGEFAAYLRQNSEHFDSIEQLPHYPAFARAYYHHPRLPAATGQALGQLLNRFSPSTAVDADLIHALILTAFWGGAPGQRPAFLIDSEEDDVLRGRGIGKSKLSQAVARLSGGHLDARPGEDYDKLMTRLLSPLALDRRIVTLDNVKTLRFSWADLEGLLTSDSISGRCLYVGEGSRPNTLTWIITLNGANLSRDMAQRCVPIRLSRPSHDPAWESETWKLIDSRRLEIIADIIAELQRPAPPLSRFSRWSAWEQAVLAHVKDPASAQRAIEQRQDAIDDDRAEADLVRQAFIVELKSRGHFPDEEAVWIPSATAAEIVNRATGEKYPIKRASSFLATLPIAELRKCDYKGNRGWAWRGEKVAPDQRLTDLQQLEEWQRTPFDS